VRNAPDREELCAAVSHAAGAPVTVLSGAQEAHAAFRGALASLTVAPAGLIGLADVGGGSCELAWGTTRGGVEAVLSVPVGSAVLTHRHVRGDPPSPAELGAVRAGARVAFASVAADPPVLIGALAVGGGATSLGRLVGPRLTRHTLGEAIGTVVVASAEQVAARFDLNARRARLLPAALILLQESVQALGLPLDVASGGLREGLLLDVLQRAQG